MQVYYDLHIHSALSPCGDLDMTPNNVVNMAKLKGLDMISLTDHNTACNLSSFKKIADDAGITFLPGIELNTSEEVHLLAYFYDIDNACEFGDFIYNSLPDIKNDEKLFGPQIILDENDEPKGSLDKLLFSALPFSFDECLDLITKAGGVPVPAHINRESNSLIYMMGFIPESDLFHTVEVYDNGNFPETGNLKIITSSDAHYLENIHEKEYALELSDNSIKSLLNFIK